MDLRNAVVVAVLPAVNVERMARFYEQTLRLKRDRLSTPDNVVFSLQWNTMLALYRRSAPSRSDHTAAEFLVEDLESTMDTLVERGVKFERYDLPNLKTDERGIWESDAGKAAWFRDPEGNMLAVTQPAPRLVGV